MPHRRRQHIFQAAKRRLQPVRKEVDRPEQQVSER